MPANNEETKKLLIEYTQMSTDFRHMKESLDVMAQTIGRLSERINTLEMRLAVNDVHTGRNSNWLQWVATGIGGILMAYIAVKVGLK